MAVIQDAFCPHLGAHVGVQVRVVGETIRCPFHGWRYDTAGQCVEIPYCDEIPERARLRTWHCEEKNGEVYIWFHPENIGPQWALPELTELGNPDWTNPRYTEFLVPAHVQDIAENSCDPVHFQFVHSMMDVPPSEIELFDDGRRMRAVSYSTQDTPVGTFDMELIRETWNMGLNSVESRGIPTCGLYMFTSTSPIDRETTITRWLLTCTSCTSS